MIFFPFFLPDFEFEGFLNERKKKLGEKLFIFSSFTFVENNL